MAREFAFVMISRRFSSALCCASGVIEASARTVEPSSSRRMPRPVPGTARIRSVPSPSPGTWTSSYSRYPRKVKWWSDSHRSSSTESVMSRSGTGSSAPEISSASASAWARMRGQSSTALRTSPSTRSRSARRCSSSPSSRMAPTSMRIQLSIRSPGIASSGSTSAQTSVSVPASSRRTTITGCTSSCTSLRADSAAVTESTRNGMSSVTTSTTVWRGCSDWDRRSFSSPGLRCCASSRWARAASIRRAGVRSTSSSSGAKRQ